MMQVTLETPDHVHLLMCGDDVEVLDEETIEVTAPDWLGRGRMPVEAWMVRELIRWEDHEGLVEIGIEVLASLSRARLN